jgi:desulfoferrodoxin-like iron-binding protein
LSRPICVGRVYRCRVCGAEVLVIHASSQALDPHCCHAPMEPLDRVAAVYRCEVCGAEVAVLRGEESSLELVCCHRPMVLRESKAPTAG